MEGGRPTAGSSKGARGTIPPGCLETRCREHLSAFEDSADPGAFQAFYSLSLPLFSWYAGRLLGGDRKEEVDGLLHRFYAFLCEEALSPTGRLPRENLLGWCKAALANLVELHLRGDAEGALQHFEQAGKCIGRMPSPRLREVALRHAGRFFSYYVALHRDLTRDHPGFTAFAGRFGRTDP